MGLENLVSFEQGANSKLVYQSQQDYISIEASNEVVKYDSGGKKLWSFALPLDYQHYFGDLPRSGLAAAPPGKTIPSRIKTPSRLKTATSAHSNHRPHQG